MMRFSAVYRKAIPLNKNEGIYVRNVQSGQVSTLHSLAHTHSCMHAMVCLPTQQIRAVMGPQAYLLQAFEEMYQKPLSPLVEEILR